MLRTGLRLTTVFPLLSLLVALGITAPSASTAQVVSLSTGSVTIPPAPPPGPCPGAFSPAGDLYEPVSGVTVPLGPPGCGLGWPFAALPGNVDAFSSGSGLGSPPHGAGSISVAFSVDALATGTRYGTCVTSAPGSNPPDVASEACGLDFGFNANQASTDAADDLFLTSANIMPLGGLPPAPGSMVNYQVFDGNGAPPVFGCQFTPFGGISGLVEPADNSPGNDPIDDTDALDLAPVAAWDFGPNGVPDVPVYYSVDAATAATTAGAVLPDDVIVTVGGGAALYAGGASLGLGAGNDIDGLVVIDAFFDGIYAPFPGPDAVLYSLSPTSAAIGTPDGCLGIPIGAGDILMEGTVLGSPGVPCIYLHAGDINLWDDAVCGANPVTGALAGDNIDGFDLLPGSPAPTPLCGPAPMPDGLCRLADPVDGPGKSIMKIKRKFAAPLTDKADKFSWKWGKGVATATADFMNPDTSSNTYRLCIYDSSASPQPLMQKGIIPGGVDNDCSGNPCWKLISDKGFKYVNKAPRRSAGLINVQFKEGDAGKSKMQVKGKERLINPPAPLALTSPVVAQLLIYDGITTECFKTTFTAPFHKQDADDFIAKGP
jgi:hypothetical protein